MADLEALKNFGIRELGAAPAEGPKTIMVVGVARGGTSMVAGALSCLGVFMGDKANSPVYEDVRLARAIEGGDWSTVRSTIAEYDGRFPIWGFKRPATVAHLGALHPLLRNPVYLVIFRDLFATANRNVLSMRADLIRSMRQAHEANDAILTFLERNQSPCLLLSTEKVILRRELFVEQLVRYLGLGDRVTEAERTRAVEFITIDPPAYLDRARLQFHGRLDRIQAEFAAGWAYIKQHPKPAVVQIFVNGSLVGTATANVPRPDVKKRALHPTGRCGFRFEFPADKQPAVGDSIAARFELGGDELHKSPRVLSPPPAEPAAPPAEPAAEPPAEPSPL